MTDLTLFPGGEDAIARVPFERLPVPDAHFQSRARREGAEFDAIALEFLERAGSRVVLGRHHIGAYPVDAQIIAANGLRLIVAAHGQLDDSGRQPGLQRTDTLAKLAWRAVMLKRLGAPPLIAATSHLPKRGSACCRQLADLGGVCDAWLVDVVATVGDLAGFQRLHWYFTTEPPPTTPRPAPWRTARDHDNPQKVLFDSGLDDA
jgi:hypothetical protein